MNPRTEFPNGFVMGHHSGYVSLQLRAGDASISLLFKQAEAEALRDALNAELARHVDQPVQVAA